MIYNEDTGAIVIAIVYGNIYTSLKIYLVVKIDRYIQLYTFSVLLGLIQIKKKQDNQTRKQKSKQTSKIKLIIHNVNNENNKRSQSAILLSITKKKNHKKIDIKKKPITRATGQISSPKQKKLEWNAHNIL